MPSPSKTASTPWTAEHSQDVLQEIIKLVLTHRRDIYATPSLSDVNENGGHRINQKILQILRKSCVENGGRKEMVDDLIKAMKGANNGAEKSSPTKKRKVKDELE